MKKLYFTISCILLMHQVLLAQDQIEFIYDAAGNRILRNKSGALPVTLVHFTAKKVTRDTDADMALLTWQTTSVTNADRFEIERNQNGKNWFTIGSVMPQGGEQSGSWYSFTDENPMNGRFVATENLYRLKMIDHGEEGKFAYSQIVSLKFEGLVNVYPNPVKDLLLISGTGKVQIINHAGKVVFRSDLIPREGIPLTGLPAGVYLVKITHPDGDFTIKKFVKQ